MNYKLFVCLCVNNSIEPTSRNLCRESFLKITMACFKNRKKNHWNEGNTDTKRMTSSTQLRLFNWSHGSRDDQVLLCEHRPKEYWRKVSFSTSRKLSNFAHRNASVIFFLRSFGPEKGSKIWDNVMQNFKNAPAAWYFDKINANLAAIPPYWPQIKIHNHENRNITFYC